MCTVSEQLFRRRARPVYMYILYTVSRNPTNFREKKLRATEIKMVNRLFCERVKYIKGIVCNFYLKYSTGVMPQTRYGKKKKKTTLIELNMRRVTWCPAKGLYKIAGHFDGGENPI